MAFGLGELAMWGVGVPLASMALSRLVEGSPEDQMRKQYKLQRELESESARGDGGYQQGMGGLLGGEPSPAEIEALLMERDRTSKMAELSELMHKVRMTDPAQMRKIREILGTGEARIKAIQSERPLSSLEIISHLENMGV